MRHVRDTHRNKPIRVIDLSKSEDPEIAAKYGREIADFDDILMAEKVEESSMHLE